MIIYNSTKSGFLDDVLTNNIENIILGAFKKKTNSSASPGEFEEANSSAYLIRQYEGKQLSLPNNKAYYPSVENLAYHRNRFGYNS